jgi:hypothetical protein
MSTRELSDEDVQRMSKNDLQAKINKGKKQKPKIYKRKKNRVSNYLKIDGGFTLLPHKLITSPVYNDLTYAERSIYQILLTNWNRDVTKADKEFICTYETIQGRMIDSKGKVPNDSLISKSLKHLEALGFIFIRRGGRNNPARYKIDTARLM